MKKTTLDIVKETGLEYLKEYLGRKRHHPKGNLGKLEDRQKIANSRTQQPLGKRSIVRYKHYIEEDDVVINPDDKMLSSVPSTNKKEYQK